jgi:hypothetical protein
VGARVAAQSADGDAVEGGIGLSVAAAVKAATAGFAGGGVQWIDAAQGREGGLTAESIGIVAGGDEQGCGVVGTDAAAGQQSRAVPVIVSVMWALTSITLTPAARKCRASAAP